MSRSIREIIRNPLLLLTALGHRELLNFIDDETYLKLAFRANLGKKLNLDAPKTFSEKLQWLKLRDRQPVYTRWVDKQEAKILAAQRIGEEYIIPTLGVWDSFEDIDFDALPEKFVLKCTHDSGGLVICRDKSRLDKAAAKKKIEKCLHHSYYWGLREWPYKEVPRRIIAEEYLSDDSRKDLSDYKVHVFNGEPRAVLVCSDRYSSLTEDFYSETWEHFDVRRPTHPNADTPAPKPEQLPELLRLARLLAEDIPFARADFYIVNGKIYFGELTFYPASGLTPFVPESWDETFGSWLSLPQKGSEN